MSDDESDEDDGVFLDLYERFPDWDDALAPFVRTRLSNNSENSQKWG